jgi:hypothetical protein
MRSSTSCICRVSMGPTAVVNIARHWNIGASNGAFFFLRRRQRPVPDSSPCRSPSLPQVILDHLDDVVDEGPHL